MLLKAGIIACAVCAGAGGTALWVKADRPVRSPEARTTMPSFLELHNRAYLENLPVQDVKDPF